MIVFLQEIISNEQGEKIQRYMLWKTKSDKEAKKNLSLTIYQDKKLKGIVDLNLKGFLISRGHKVISPIIVRFRHSSRYWYYCVELFSTRLLPVLCTRNVSTYFRTVLQIVSRGQVPGKWKNSWFGYDFRRSF